MIKSKAGSTYQCLTALKHLLIFGDLAFHIYILFNDFWFFITLILVCNLPIRLFVLFELPILLDNVLIVLLLKDLRLDFVPLVLLYLELRLLKSPNCSRMVVPYLCIVLSKPMNFMVGGFHKVIILNQALMWLLKIIIPLIQFLWKVSVALVVISSVQWFSRRTFRFMFARNRLIWRSKKTVWLIVRILRRNSSFEELWIRLVNISYTMCRQCSTISCWRRKRKSFWYEILALFSLEINIRWLLCIAVVDVRAFMSLMSKRCCGLWLHLRRYCRAVNIQVLPLNCAI